MADQRTTNLVVVSLIKIKIVYDDQICGRLSLEGVGIPSVLLHTTQVQHDRPPIKQLESLFPADVWWSTVS